MSTTVRVSGGNVILYNLIRKKKIVDLNKKFRIYTRCIESERYNISTEMWHHVKDYVIHFQQDDVDIPVDMYFIGSKKLPKTDNYTYLGIPFDESLSLKPIQSKLNSNLNVKLNLYFRFLINKSVPLPLKKYVLISFILSLVILCSSLWFK